MNHNPRDSVERNEELAKAEPYNIHASEGRCQGKHDDGGHRHSSGEISYLIP